MEEAFVIPGAEFLRPKQILDYRRPGDLYEVVALDPGETTGWAVFGVYMIALRSGEYSILSNIDFWSEGQITGPEDLQAKKMVDLCEAWPAAHRVVEDFVLRKFTQSRSLLAPVRITAKFEHGLWLRDPDDCKYILQQPSLAMTAVTDERLKAWGYWNPLVGQEHARDAVRHAITWLRRAKEILKIEVSR